MGTRHYDVRDSKGDLIFKGDFLVKTNGECFGSRMGRTPFIQVKGIEKFMSKRLPKGTVRFNNRYITESSLVTLISEERSREIQEIWDTSSIISEPRPGLNSSCFREDNGEKKRALTGSIQRILFKYRMQHPEGGYEAYTCRTCGEIHIGKTRNHGNDTAN